MKPIFGNDPMRSKTAESPELRDHVGLIGIPRTDGHRRRIFAIAQALQGRVKASEPAELFGCHAY